MFFPNEYYIPFIGMLSGQRIVTHRSSTAIGRKVGPAHVSFIEFCVQL